MDSSERVQGFARSALVSALQSRHEATFRMMLEFLAKGQTQAMEQETCRDVLRSLDADGWDSFDAKEFRKTAAPWVFECKLKGVSEEVIYEPILATAKNPFSHFAMHLRLTDFTKLIKFYNFNRECKKRRAAIIRHRKERLAERNKDISEQGGKEQ